MLCYREMIPKERKEDEPEGCAPVFDLMPEPCTVEEGDTAKFMSQEKSNFPKFTHNKGFASKQLGPNCLDVT